MNASKEKKIESTPVEEKKVVKKTVTVNKNEEILKDFIIPEPKKAKKVSDEEKEIKDAEG